jgi:transposase-like protein
VLAALPKSAHPGAKKALAEIWNAEDKRHARNAVKAFDAAYGAKFPKATAKITEDADVLLAFFDYPAQHWIHLRTTNPIESTFSTVRHRAAALVLLG